MPIASKIEVPDSDISTLLARHPLFSSLTNDDLKILTSLFTSHSFHAGEIIVAEEEIVDSFYIIIDGRAEVGKRVQQENNITMQPMALLGVGDAIGLSKTGLFSATGMRTATVTALEDMIAIKMDLPVFFDFIKNHSGAHQSMLENANILIRTRFLKESAPFAQLPTNRLRELAEKIEEKTFPAETILFKQGDTADCCYLVKSGLVEISITSTDGDKVLAELESSSIFGEAALLLEMPRNATARTLESTTLLIINKSILLDLVESEASIAEAMMRIQNARVRPTRYPHVEMYKQIMPDGDEIITLKNTEFHKYFRISKYGAFIWEMLDGKNSFSEIALAFYNEFNIFNPGMISTLIYDLNQSGFVQLDRKANEDDNKKLHWLTRALIILRQLMEPKWAFGNVDGWITKTYNHFFWPLFSRTGQVILALISIGGLAVFIYYFSHAADLLNTSPIKWRLVILSYALIIPTIIMHELAHAYATKSYGRHVHAFGVGWLWVGPFAYCDTSDMWLANKKARIVVDIAGLYLNVIIAGIASLCMLFIHTPEIVIVLWLFSLLSYLIVIANLSPTMEFDGYYCLMDILDKPNLRESAVEWLADRVFGKNQPVESFLDSAKQHHKEAVYWISTLAFIIFLEMIVPIFFLSHLLHGLFDVSNPYTNMLFLLFIVFISGASVWAQISKKRKNQPET